MDHITVDFEEFYQLVQEMKQDGIKKVTLAIVENDEPDDGVPCFLSMTADDPDEPGIEVEYDYLDAVSEE